MVRPFATLAAFALLFAGFVAIKPSAASAAAAVRGAYGGPTADVKAAGFNTVNAGPFRSTLDSLGSRGMKAVIWLGSYRDSCSFDLTDDEIRQKVGAVAGHPAILAYQISDEPEKEYRDGCPGAVQQHKDRTKLIHGLDPGKPTYTVIATWDGVDAYPYRHWVGATDIMGLDVYPCRYNSPTCSFGMIDKAVASAAAAGVPRYWAVVQAFGDGYYRMPTGAEIAEQLRRWNASRMEGYFVYHWSQQASWMVDWLAKHPTVVDVVRRFNGASPTRSFLDRRRSSRISYVRWPSSGSGLTARR